MITQLDRLLRWPGVVAVAAIAVPPDGPPADCASRGAPTWLPLVEQAARMLATAPQELAASSLRVGVAHHHVIFVDAVGSPNNRTIVAAVLPAAHELGKSLHRIIRMVFRNRGPLVEAPKAVATAGLADIVRMTTLTKAAIERGELPQQPTEADLVAFFERHPITKGQA